MTDVSSDINPLVVPLSLPTGCMEALSRYKAQSATLLEQGEASEQLIQESRTLLARLIDVDPDRRGRYQDVLRAGGR